MQLGWGVSRFLVNGCKVSTRNAPILLNGIRVGRKLILSVEGFLEGDGQADLSAQTVLMEYALSVPYQDLVLYQDNGLPSATRLINAQSATGVVITDGPNFPTTAGDYATVRRFNFEATADYYVGGSDFAIVAFKETLDMGGGGPLYATLPALKGASQRQLIYEQTPYTARQSGQVVMLGGYADPVLPTWSEGQGYNPALTHVGRVGPDKDARLYKNWVTTWEYFFESPSPLVGLPNFWYPGAV